MRVASGWKTCTKCTAKFHPEEHATLVVLQRRSVPGIIGFGFMM